MSQSIIVDSPVSDSEELAPDAENEIEVEEQEEARTAEADAKEETSVPEKYRGKSIEEIIEMHQNAEKLIGRQANEVGTYRELVQSLADAKRATDITPQDTAEKPVEVTSDDIWENPAEAISKVVESVLAKRLAPIEEKTATSELRSEVQQFMADNPDAEQIGAMPEFNEWVQRSQYRMKDAQAWIEKQDTTAADRLLSDFRDYMSVQKRDEPTDEQPEPAKPGIEEARAASTESGRNSSGDNRTKKTLSKREVMRVFINDRERYESTSFQKMLMKHAQEGTLVD